MKQKSPPGGMRPDAGLKRKLVHTASFLLNTAVYINIHGNLGRGMSQDFRKCFAVKAHFRAACGKSMTKGMDIDDRETAFFQDVLKLSLNRSRFHTERAA